MKPRIVSLLLVCVTGINAHVTRMVVEKRESPAYGGQVFGQAGQYETLSGHFYGELDPKDPHNKIITDIALAPRNARGMVEYSATFAISKPVDMSKASGVLFYNVPNRGGGAPTGSPEGHVSVVSGWQGDIAPRAGLQTITVPVAKNADGSAITGPVIERFINMPPGTTTLAIDTAAVCGPRLPASGDTGYHESQPDATDQPDRPGYRCARGRVGVCRLQREAVSRHTGPREDLPEERL